MRVPKWAGGGDLDETTQLYLDTHIALTYFHMRLPEYVEKVPQLERLLYQFYLMLSGAKETHAQKRSQQQADEERDVREMVDRGGMF